MKQTFTIAKIGGQSAAATVAKFREWQMVAQPMVIPEISAEECTRFLNWLDDAANAPPILFHCSYVDMWSGGDIFDRWLAPDGGNDLLRASHESTELFVTHSLMAGRWFLHWIASR